jgi:hypothetical protein
MAFLSRPGLGLGTPSRPSPPAPGSVPITVRIPLFIDLLERCTVEHCDAGRAPIFEITAEVWSTDRNEPKGTVPITPDRPLFPVIFRPRPGVQTRFRRVQGSEITAADPVPNDPTLFQFVINDGMTVPEALLNEDWGPFPLPGTSPLPVTRDELFLRVYLASLFSAWQIIQTIDSDVESGQFFGP